MDLRDTQESPSAKRRKKIQTLKKYKFKFDYVIQQCSKCNS